MVRGPKSASARPGPCARPRSADALARREYHPARQTPGSSSFVLGRWRRPQGRPQGAAACGRSSLTSGRVGWSRVGPTGPAQSPSCSEATASSQGARGTGSSGERIGGRARWRRRLVVGRGGGIEPGLVACLPDADHNKMRAHGHASDLPERTPRDPSLHLTAPYAIPPLSCGNTLQPGAARGVAS